MGEPTNTENPSAPQSGRLAPRSSPEHFALTVDVGSRAVLQAHQPQFAFRMASALVDAGQHNAAPGVDQTILLPCFTTATP
jgi:hypothetical protein